MNSITINIKLAHGRGKPATGMPALKLMAFENEYYRNTDALSHEIKRLRREVWMMTKRYNGVKREVKELMQKVRSQPPPMIPERIKDRVAKKEGEIKDRMEIDEEREEEREEIRQTRTPSPTPPPSLLPPVNDTSPEIQKLLDFIRQDRDIAKLIAKVRLQPPPAIPQRLREREREDEGIDMEKSRDGEEKEDEDTEMKEAEEVEKEKPEKDSMEAAKDKPVKEKEPDHNSPTRSPVRKPSPRLLTSPSPSPPQNKTELAKALAIIRQDREEKDTTVSKPDTVASIAKSTPPAVLPLAPMIKDETTLAAERAMGRHDKWDRAVRRFYKDKGEDVGEVYENYRGDRRMCSAIGQWSIDKYKTELTTFDFWGWQCVRGHGKEKMEEIGKAWLITSERVRKIKMVNQVYRE